MRVRTILILSVCFAGSFSHSAQAQTSQYKRAKKSPTTDASTDTSPSTASPDSAGTSPKSGTVGDSAQPAKKDDAIPTDKVDISDLENRYWESKDTEFHVVQNRQYTKAKRLSFSLQYGPIINSTYVTGSQIGFTGNYYFSERFGVQLMYDAPQVTTNTLINSFVSQNGVSPNYNIIKGYYGAGISWIPFYAKMSVLEQKILYFDMAVTPTVGITQYQQQTIDGTGSSLGAFTYGLDISQHFYLNRTFAIRWDLLNRFYSENVVKYYKNGLGADPGSQGATTTTFLIGVQAFF